MFSLERFVPPYSSRHEAAQVASYITGEIHPDATTIPMSPDGTIQWEVHDVASHGGKLIVPKQVEAETISALLSPAPSHRAEFQAGSNAKVYKVGELAVKRFMTRGADLGELPSMRASVSLQTGLERVNRIIGGYRITTPDNLGMFLPYPSSNDTGPDRNPIWVMEYISGQHPSHTGVDTIGYPPIPSGDERLKTYALAMEAAGARLDDARHDDRYDNILIHTAGENDPHASHELIKLDIDAKPGKFLLD